MDILGTIQKVVAVAFQWSENLVYLKPNQNTSLSDNVEFQLPDTDSNDVLVSEAAAATMTNKTLTDPVITNPEINGSDAATVTGAELELLAGLQADASELDSVVDNLSLGGVFTTDAAVEIEKGSPNYGDVLTWSTDKFVTSTLSTDGWAIGTISDAMTLVINTEYENDGTPDVDTLTLPSAPAQGSRIRLIDTGQDWNTNNIVISRGGTDTVYNGSDTTLTLDIENGVVELIYYGTNWSVIVGQYD